MTNPQNTDGWIPWSGGECPIADGIEHQVQFRGGSFSQDYEASTWYWGHANHSSDIVAYRVIE